MPRVVFSIHGIATDGKWQNGISDVLNHFFQYTPLSYSEYRPLARALWGLAGDILIIFATLGVSIWLFRQWSVQYASAVCVAGILTAVWTHFANRKRMERVVSNVYKQLMEPVGGLTSPSVVAHSLGTLLVSRALFDHSSLSLGNVILDGCVVKRRYPWDETGEQFVNVFNEIGGKDIVPWIAGLLRWTVPQMGSAGAQGFKGPMVDAKVHYPGQEGPVFYYSRESCCPEHGELQPQYKVYNVRYAALLHSGYHDGVFHALDFWLPRLLGFDPQTYLRFQRDCIALAIAQRERRGVDYRVKRDEMLQTCYGWRPGTLWSVIEEQVKATPGADISAADMGKFADRVLTNVIQMVYMTQEKLPRPNEAGIPLRLSDLQKKEWDYLDPRLAVQHSVAATLELWETQRI